MSCRMRDLHPRQPERGFKALDQLGLVTKGLVGRTQNEQQGLTGSLCVGRSVAEHGGAGSGDISSGAMAVAQAGSGEARWGWHRAMEERGWL